MLLISNQRACKHSLGKAPGCRHFNVPAHCCALEQVTQPDLFLQRSYIKTFLSAVAAFCLNGETVALRNSSSQNGNSVIYSLMSFQNFLQENVQVRACIQQTCRGMMIYITKPLKKHHTSKSPFDNNLRLQVNIYIYAFGRCFYHCISRYTFTFLSVLAFPGNRTHDFGVASDNAVLFVTLYKLKVRFYVIDDVKRN